MRSAKAQDFWRTVYQRSYSGKFVEFDLNGLNNIGKITAPNGIFAICGLNGAGKSTIISAVKSVLGIPLSDYDRHRLGEKTVCAVFSNKGTEVQCTNTKGQQLIDQGWGLDKIHFLDCASNAAIQDFLISQPDLDELLSQFEEYELTPEEVLELNNIVGKRYDSCGFRILEEIDDYGNIPYYSVSVGSVDYDSRGMGSGEHFLFYLFGSIKSIEKGSILFVEEPETYVSIASQERLLNYLAKQIADKGITVILTTHSPYILKQIRNENIRMVSRVNNMVNISIPGNAFSAEDILGMRSTNKGTFFVEDRVAADFLSVCLEDCAPILLREYTIDIVGGEAEISSRLKFPRSEKIKYNFVGLYDGDMRNRLDRTDLRWNYCFLPGEKPLEMLFQYFAEQQAGIEWLSDSLNVDQNILFAYIGSLTGTDYHDWFEELRKLLAIDGKMLVRAFYSGMKEKILNTDAFLTELKLCLESM